MPGEEKLLHSASIITNCMLTRHQLMFYLVCTPENNGSSQYQFRNNIARKHSRRGHYSVINSGYDNKSEPPVVRSIVSIRCRVERWEGGLMSVSALLGGGDLED